MAKEFVMQLTRILADAGFSLTDDAPMQVKHFFSGAACYVHGRICVTLTPVGLGLKLPQQERDRLLKQCNFKLLQYFPNGPVKRDYVLLPSERVTSSKALSLLLHQCVQFVSTLD